MERAVLTWVHEHATPSLDAIFLVSHDLGTFAFCLAVVTLAAAWHLARRDGRGAAAWVVVGVLAYTVPELVKAVVARPRPTLWPWMVHVVGSSFPSGHAAASAALYPFLAWDALRASPRLEKLAYALGCLVAVFVGVGRVYLGVHWPGDVVAGWALGLALGAVGITWLDSGDAGRLGTGAPVRDPA